MIRQAISCDICGSEKRQTNHWFVAYEQSGELRVSGWSSRIRTRPGSKHLCGQTCVHKLVDDFMAKDLAARSQASNKAKSEANFQAVDIGNRFHAVDAGNRFQTVDAGGRFAPETEFAMEEFESSARLIPTPTTIQPSRPMVRATMELVAVPSRPRIEEPVPLPGEPPSYASRKWRIEAWKREREREMRAADHRPMPAVRRRSG